MILPDSMVKTMFVSPAVPSSLPLLCRTVKVPLPRSSQPCSSVQHQSSQAIGVGEAQDTTAKHNAELRAQMLLVCFDNRKSHTVQWQCIAFEQTPG